MGARDQEAGRIGSIHYRISHSAGVTLNSNPPSFLERKNFYTLYYTIPAECRILIEGIGKILDLPLEELLVPF
jgi:hypothetical protein